MKFKEIDEATAVRSLVDIDVAVIGNTIAREGGLNPFKDAIFFEKGQKVPKDNVNILAVQKKDQQNKKLLKLREIYHNKENQKYIKEKFDGTKVPVNEDVDYLKEK